MGTGLLLLAMLIWVTWVIARENGRRDYWQDEQDAETFIAELRAPEPEPAEQEVLFKVDGTAVVAVVGSMRGDPIAEVQAWRDELALAAARSSS